VDLLDEALDLERGAGGDLVLIEPQLLAALLVAKINLHAAARDESAAYEQHRDEKILAHEPAAGTARTEDIGPAKLHEFKTII
jgi:hypothetical protein